MSGYMRRCFDVWQSLRRNTEDDIPKLIAFAESIAAEARGQAIKGCCAAAEALREGPNTPTIGALVETMRRTIDTPRPDLRLVAREDLAKVIEAAETFVNNSSLVCVEIRKAINRLRAGEE